MDQKRALKHKSWPRRDRDDDKVGGAPYPPGRVLLPRHCLVDPLDMRLAPKIPINTKTPRKKPRSGVPPPQASVATKNQSRPSSTLLEVAIITGGRGGGSRRGPSSPWRPRTRGRTSPSLGVRPWSKRDVPEESLPRGQPGDPPDLFSTRKHLIYTETSRT